MTLDDVLYLSRRELDPLLRSHPGVPLDRLRGRSFGGISLGLPRWAERLTWKTFKKVFDDAGRGFNEGVHQRGPHGGFETRHRFGRPVRYGHFTLRATESSAEIDYGLARDPLVELGPGLLLGVTDLALGPVRVRTPTYFALVGPLEA